MPNLTSITIASLMLAIAFSASAAELAGKVVAVKDGDSIVLLDDTHRQYQVRLGGIDAPELSQAYGRISRQALARMIYGQTVHVLWEKTDPYGRTVGKVLRDGQDINLRQIEAGYAWHYRHYQSEQSSQDRAAYGQAEIDARQAHLGLWQDSQQTPPWRYRRQHRRH